MSLLLLALGIWVGSGWVVLCFEHGSRLAAGTGVGGLITVAILSVFPVVRVLMREAVGESRLPFIFPKGGFFFCVEASTGSLPAGASGDEREAGSAQGAANRQVFIGTLGSASRRVSKFFDTLLEFFPFAGECFLTSAELRKLLNKLTLTVVGFKIKSCPVTYPSSI
jgi:hypothetical protein